jgi:hypothetical protein
MCIQPVFKHSCGCVKPVVGAIEKCPAAERQNLEQCENVVEKSMDEPNPCIDCFQNQASQNEEEQLRAALQESAGDYETQASHDEEEQLRAAMQESAIDWRRRAQEEEEDAVERALQESIEGVSLEDRWEVDDTQFQALMQQSLKEHFEKQNREFREMGLVPDGDEGLVGVGGWRRRETIHDRRKYAFEPEGWSGGYEDDEGEDGEEAEEDEEDGAWNPEALPEEGGEATIIRLEDFPENIGPDGKKYQRVLYHHIGCGHDVDRGINYDRPQDDGELNAIRLPRPGRCETCGGIQVPPYAPAYEGKGKGKAMPPLPPESPPPMPAMENVQEPVPELSLAEVRAMRLAMLDKRGET